jgi:glycosyltransferase involved in cell wall biosynthesis
VKALLVGDGSQRTALEALAGELGVADRLVMPGNKDQGFLSLVIPRAAVVVSPHTGRALSEAALGAAPVVAYDVDWQGELIETGRTGILVSHGDVDALAGAALKLLDDRDLATTVGANLRQRAREMLDPAALDAHEREQYRKLEGRFSARRWARRLAR